MGRGLVEQAAVESRSFCRAYAAAAQVDADAKVELGITYLAGVGTLKDRT